MPNGFDNSKVSLQMVFEVAKMNNTKLLTLEQKLDDYMASVGAQQKNCIERFAKIEQKQKTQEDMRKEFKAHQSGTRKYRMTILALLVSIFGVVSGFTLGLIKLYYMIYVMGAGG